jgi:hypothetical protein
MPLEPMSRIERIAAVVLSVLALALMVDSCRLVMTLDAQTPQPEVLSRTGNTPVSRTTSWAEAVAACESHGGVAVPRATRVLGRSADLPVCVPQLGE